MINATHYVLDLETMGKGPRAAIAAIGCVRIERGRLTGSLYCRVSLETSLAAGLQVDASTIEWWLQQEEGAREEIYKPGAIRLEAALARLAEFMGCNHLHKPKPDAMLWGNGSGFDNVIVGNAFDACGIQRPWLFWNDRDLRTLLALYPQAKKLPFEGTKHHALDDARHEARQLVNALQLHADHLRGAAKMVPPAGYMLTPAEPTPAMVAAAEDAHMPFGDMHIAIQCALHAAQQPEAL